MAQSYTWTGRWRQASKIAERGLARLAGASSDRAFLLVTLGLSNAVAGRSQGAHEAFKAAVKLSEEFTDSARKCAILAYSSEFKFLFLGLHEALEDSNEGTKLLAQQDEPWARAQMLSPTQNSLFHLGRAQEAAKAGEELKPLATWIGHLAALSYCRRISAWTEFGEQPNLLRLKDRLEQDLDANRAAELEVFVNVSHAQLSVVEYLRGNWDKALDYAQEAYRPQTHHIMRGFVLGALFRQRACLNDRDGALTLLRQNSETLARPGQLNTYGSWVMPLLVIEGLVALGERDQAAELYPIVRELIATGTVCLAFCSRFPRTIAGVAAGAAGQWDIAEDHFRIALQQAQSFPNLLEQADIRRFHAMMLIDRATQGDCESARVLLSDALQSYQRIGMPGHVKLTQSLLHEL